MSGNEVSRWENPGPVTPEPPPGLTRRQYARAKHELEMRAFWVEADAMLVALRLYGLERNIAVRKHFTAQMVEQMKQSLLSPDYDPLTAALDYEDLSLWREHSSWIIQQGFRCRH